jgi:hypothetical protein
MGLWISTFWRLYDGLSHGIVYQNTFSPANRRSSRRCELSKRASLTELEARADTSLGGKEAEVVWLKVQHQDVSNLKLTWGGKRGAHSAYAIAGDTLKDTVQKIEAQLSQLSEWSRNPDRGELASRLRELAILGQELNFIIFDAYVCDDTPTDIRRLKEWMSRQYEGGDRELCVNAHPSIRVPWGLIYDGDPVNISKDATDVAHFTDFWALKYQLSVLLSGCHQPDLAKPRPREAFRMLSAINRFEYQHAETDLGELYEDFGAILKEPVGVSYTVEALETMIQDIAENNSIVHFFGHHRNGVLDLGGGADNQISVQRMKMLMARLTELRGRTHGEAPCGLIILNACESATGASDHSMRSAVARPGLCGLIATEAVVPRKFALNFGYRLLKSMVNDGKSVGETMEELRHQEDLWPLSLLYGCYAYPDYRIAPRA